MVDTPLMGIHLTTPFFNQPNNPSNLRYFRILSSIVDTEKSPISFLKMNSKLVAQRCKFNLEKIATVLASSGL